MARSIDPRSVGPQTLAIHAGERPDAATGASAPALHLSSTFVTDRPEGFSAHDLDPQGPFVYGRWGNPTVRALEEKLAAMEGAESCAAYASGMAAGAAILLSLLSSGDHLIISDVAYAGLAELARDTLPRFGIVVSTVDTSDTANIANAMRPETKIVFIDTPCNPLLRLTDIAAAARVAHEGGALLAVDNTFATPVGTRPIALGADLVMHSATKYLCGHGDAIGGAVCGRKGLIQTLTIEATVHCGGVMAPFNAWAIARGAATLPLRMRAHQDGALAVARFLEDHAGVARVVYPGLDSHPQRDLARAQMANTSAMIAFQAKGDGAALAARMAERLKIIHYAVSLGHHRSLVCYMPTQDMLRSSFRLEGAQRDAYRAWAGEGVFRLSVGLEDAADLINDLDALL